MYAWGPISLLIVLLWAMLWLNCRIISTSHQHDNLLNLSSCFRLQRNTDKSNPTCIVTYLHRDWRRMQSWLTVYSGSADNQNVDIGIQHSWNDTRWEMEIPQAIPLSHEAQGNDCFFLSLSLSLFSSSLLYQTAEWVKFRKIFVGVLKQQATFHIAK